jgi:hypothetical protein
MSREKTEVRRASDGAHQASETTTKSSMHHASRRYECLCMTKPYAMIFMTNSNVNMAR